MFYIVYLLFSLFISGIILGVNPEATQDDYGPAIFCGLFWPLIFIVLGPIAFGEWVGKYLR